MRIRLGRAWQKSLLLAAVVLAGAVYLLFAARMYLAAGYAGKGDRAGLERAAQLEPLNATHFYLLGRHAFLDEQDVPLAVQMYQHSVELDPHGAHYWLDLAVAYNASGDAQAMRRAITSALAVDSHTPETLWRAANLLILDGDNDQGFALLHALVAGAPEYSADATSLAWQASGDVNIVLRQVVPPQPDAQLPFLYLTMERQDSQAAAKVWQAIVASGQPFDARRAFVYVDYNLNRNQGDTARAAWQDLARLDAAFAPYASSDNLVVNGGFEAPVLSDGLDWRHGSRNGVLLDVVPVEAHSGNDALAVSLEGEPPGDLGLEQWLALQPATTYELRAFYRSEVEGVAAPRFAVSTPANLLVFKGDEMRAANGWQEFRATFTTPLGQSVYILRLGRDNAATHLRGRLLLDDVSVTPQK